MTIRTDDPVADAATHDWETQRWLDSLPKCERCDEPIQQEKAVCIDGKYYCDECLDELRESIGDD